MKNTLRNISVQGHQFKWTIRHGLFNANFREDHIFIRIWLANQKSKPWAEIKYHFNNYWHYYGEMIAYPGDKADLQDIFQLKPVTPGLVAKMIESLLSQVGLSEQKDPTYHFVYIDGKLEKE